MMSNLQIPDVPMAMLTSLPLTKQHWVEIARTASWQTTRMNLNTFERHGVFEDASAVDVIAERLRDPVQIERSRVLPYQLMVAFVKAESAPMKIREALQDAMETATRNTPVIAGKVWILVDVSGSMGSPITGHRAGSTTAVRCVDVAALFAACLVRKNPNAGVIPFNSGVLSVSVNPRDSVMTNAKKMADLLSGGTDCSAPLTWMNRKNVDGDLVIYLSDNESWMRDRSHGATETMRQWQAFKKRNERARLVCLDLQPSGHTQAYDREDILNVGGFSDNVFSVISKFARGNLAGEHWVGVVERTDLSVA